MVDMNRLKVGSVVRIVDHFDEDDDFVNRNGLMDKWCGEVMTVRNIASLSRIYMEEDVAARSGRGWIWLPKHIAEVLKYDPDEINSGNLFDVPSGEELAAFLGVVPYFSNKGCAE